MVQKQLFLRYCIIGIGSSFPYGFNSAVMNAPLTLIHDFIKSVVMDRKYSCTETCVKNITSFCVSAFVIGGFFGTLVGGFLANRYGRKGSLYIVSLPSIASSLLMVLSQPANSFEMIMLGRFIMGFACGAQTVVGPIFLSEIAPISQRGSAGIVNQFFIICAILFAQILGLPELMGTLHLWPYLLGFTFIMTAIHVAGLRFCPESPVYLYLMKGDRQAALHALAQLRGPDTDIQHEVVLLQEEALASRKSTITDLFRVSYLRWALMVAVIVHFTQQFSGINGLVYYSVQLFESNGLSTKQACYANLGIGGTILFSTIVSLFLIDRLGRRCLLLSGFMACLISLILFTLFSVMNQFFNIDKLVYASIAMIYSFVAGFSIGPGSIPWFLVAEMFIQENRDAATSISAAVNWLSNAVVSITFPELISLIGVYTFVPFIVILLISIVLLALFLPETNGLTPSAIEIYFKRLSGYVEHKDETAAMVTDGHSNENNSAIPILV